MRTVVDQSPPSFGAFEALEEREPLTTPMTDRMPEMGPMPASLATIPGTARIAPPIQNPDMTAPMTVYPVDPPAPRPSQSKVPSTAPMPQRTVPLVQQHARPFGAIAPTLMEPASDRLTYEVFTADDTSRERATLVDAPRMTLAMRVALGVVAGVVVLGTMLLAIGSCEDRRAAANAAASAQTTGATAAGPGAAAAASATATATAATATPATATAIPNAARPATRPARPRGH